MGTFLLRYLCAAIALACLLTVSASGQKAPPCPLTDTQTNKSIAAFGKIATFVTSEPRCVNCHGGVNPYLAGTGLDPEDESAPPSVVEHFLALDHQKSDGFVDQRCRECHNHMAKRRDGSDSLWMTASPAHTFVDKDAVSLCRQFKRATGTAQDFLAHVQDDDGGNNFSGTAFNGDRGLDPKQFSDVPVGKPSISHDEFVKLAHDWVDAMGGRFQGDEGCGCELKHSRWSGQIHYVQQTTGDEGHSDLQTWGGYLRTQTTLTVTDGVGTLQGNFEQQYQDENRHGVAVGGGHVVIETEMTTSIEGSGEGTFPATLDVDVDDSRKTYSIRFGASDPASRGGKPTAIGKITTVRCYRGDCKTTERDLGMPGLPPMSPLSGTLKDRDVIDDSITVKRDQIGRSHNGTMIETMSVHLWRSSSN